VRFEATAWEVRQRQLDAQAMEAMAAMAGVELG